jgi:hypothetical protein
LGRVLTQESDVREKDLDDLRVVLKTIFCQANLHIEDTRSARAHRVSTSVKTVRPTLGPDVRHDTSRTLMSDKMTNVSARLSGKHELLINEWEVQVKFSRIHDRLCQSLHAEIGLSERKFARPSVR